MILAGKASLEEIETKWTLCDLADANEALDVKEEAEAFEARKAEEEAAKKANREG